MKKILSMLLVIILAISSQIFVVSAAPLTSEIVSKDNKESILFQNYLNNSNVDSLSVNKIRRLYDFAGNLYTLIECSPTGYVVFHNDSGRFIEEDFESPSPYIASSGKLYYGGPTEYYTKTDEKYEHTVLDESISLFYQTELSI